MGIRRHEELLALGMFGRASRLSTRIELLLKRGREFSPRASAGRVVASGIVLLGLVVAGSLTPRWIAFAQQPPNPPLSPQPAAAPASPQSPAPPKRSSPPPRPVSAEADDSLQTALTYYHYGTLTTPELSQLTISGVTADYISRMNRSGLGGSWRPLDQIVQLRAAGVTPDDAEAAARVGFPPELFLAFSEIGFPHLSRAQITAAAMQGLHPDDVRRAQAYGPNLTLEAIIRLRDDHKLDQPDAN